MAFKVSTKVNKDSKASETLVTVVYDDADAERALATQALIVKAQGHWRTNGVPANVTLKMSEFAPGTRHSSMTPEQARSVLKAEYAAASPERKKAILSELGIG